MDCSLKFSCDIYLETELRVTVNHMVRRAITKIAINSFVILILDETKQRGTNLFFKGELTIDNSCSASAT